LVWDHNYYWANMFSKEGAFHKAMEDIFEELKELLLKMPDPFKALAPTSLVKKLI
jgi:hypothetical protein